MRLALKMMGKCLFETFIFMVRSFVILNRMIQLSRILLICNASLCQLRCSLLKRSSGFTDFARGSTGILTGLFVNDNISIDFNIHFLSTVSYDRRLDRRSAVLWSIILSINGCTLTKCRWSNIRFIKISQSALPYATLLVLLKCYNGSGNLTKFIFWTSSPCSLLPEWWSSNYCSNFNYEVVPLFSVSVSCYPLLSLISSSLFFLLSRSSFEIISSCSYFEKLFSLIGLTLMLGLLYCYGCWYLFISILYSFSNALKYYLKHEIFPILSSFVSVTTLCEGKFYTHHIKFKWSTLPNYFLVQ